MDPDTDVCQTEQPQISYSFDFTAAEQSISRLRLNNRQPYSIRVQCALDNLLQPAAWRSGYYSVAGTSRRALL